MLAADNISLSPAWTIPSLNGIRAVSVVLVVLGHSGLGKFVPGGLGVTMFFFLSGYLITTLMIREREKTGSLDVWGFYARRVFRLMPPLIITLAVAYGLVAGGYLPGGISFKGISAQLFYFANYYLLFFGDATTIPAGTGILWSLSVEEHYYIFFPVIMIIFFNLGLPLRTIGLFFVMVCIAIFFWRSQLVLHGATEDRTYYASDTRIDSIMYGAILALWSNPLSKRARQMMAVEWVLLGIALVLLLITVAYRDATFRETFRYSLQGLALFPIFYLAVHHHESVLFRPLNSVIIAKIGVFSYSIYLIHYVIINLIVTNAPTISQSSFLVFISAMGLSVCYAAAIDQFIDPYFRRLRNSFQGNRKKNLRGKKIPSVNVN